MGKSEEKTSKRSFLHYRFSELKVRHLIPLQNTFSLKGYYFVSQILSPLFNCFQNADALHLFKTRSFPKSYIFANKIDTHTFNRVLRRFHLE